MENFELKIDKYENKNTEDKNTEDKNNETKKYDDLPEKFKVAIEEAKQTLNEYNKMTPQNELEKDARISDLEKYTNVKNTEVMGAIADMIFQLQTNKYPLISLLDPDEQNKRKKLIEGIDGKGGLLESTKQRLENITIEDMVIFGIYPEENNKEFETMKKNLIEIMTNTRFQIEYFSNISSHDKREKNGITYYESKITGFNNNEKITIDVGMMNNYDTEEEFKIDFRKTVIHELAHSLQNTGFEILFNTDTGIAKEIYGEDKEAYNFLNSIFTEGGSIAFANSISKIHRFDEYNIHSVLGLNYLFYSTEEKTKTYGKIFSKLRFFGSITEEEQKTLISYLKEEFNKKPIKEYLALKKQEPNVEGNKLSEITGKIYDQLLIMAGEKPEKNIFLMKIYPGRKGEKTIKEFKELAIKNPSEKSVTKI